MVDDRIRGIGRVVESVLFRECQTGVDNATHVLVKASLEDQLVEEGLVLHGEDGAVSVLFENGEVLVTVSVEEGVVTASSDGMGVLVTLPLKHKRG